VLFGAHFPTMQQSKLSFAPITAAAAAEQRTSLALKWLEEHPPEAASTTTVQPKRGPGRPAKKRGLSLEQAAAIKPAEKKARTGKYTNWFSTVFIADIMQALRRHKFSAKKAVADLKKVDPDGRYARLSDSTVRAWFDKENVLLPRFQEQLKAGIAAARSSGRPAHLTAALEEECKAMLLKLRSTGMPVNTHVIRWTLQAIFRQRDPSLLENEKFTLSRQWICWWVRKELKWRWRARTTAASKLPLDWEDQGVVIGADDKRQITACIASSLYGDLLPMQLIF
jgi:hypothetical protein